eukprot:TRINITY_DN66803_c10_g1_i1.p1 TRINITY_DN66803_c10_g1~~TRINITY_DN66803_c10_g1_i1.p1  ORF type:complete len:575 (+),score=54.15 TRINITY_DN66803_c10_g1_i1:267-1991(+)
MCTTSTQIGGLRALEEVDYQYDYQFHYDIGQMFMQLHDAHTAYNAPACYQNFVWWQPFAIASYETKKKLVFEVTSYVPNNGLAEYYETLGISIKDYFGAQVLGVNYLEATQYFADLANRGVGLSKDVNTRLNLLMAGFNPMPEKIGITLGLFQIRQRWAWQEMPLSDAQPSLSYTFKLKNGTIITRDFPWAIQATHSYTGLASFLDTYWKKGDVKDATPLRTQAYHLDHERVPDSMWFEDHPQEDVEAGMVPKFLLGNTHYRFYWLPKFKVGVIWMADMTDFKDVPRLLNETYKAAAELNITKMILDLTNNGGGYICLGRYLLDYFFLGVDYGPSDMPVSATSRHLAKLSKDLPTNELHKTFWSAWQFANENNTNFPLHETNWLTDDIIRHRAGHPKAVSQVLHLSHRSTLTECCNILPPQPPFSPKKPPPFSSSNLLMITRGLCGSTCAEFANHAHQYHGVKVVSVGGFPNRPMQYTSFPGIQVFDSVPDLDPMWKLLKGNKTDNIVPPPLPTTGEYRMCVREIYGPPPVPMTNALPLEFVWQPADYHYVPVDITEAVKPWKLWYKFLPYLSD